MFAISAGNRTTECTQDERGEDRGTGDAEPAQLGAEPVDVAAERVADGVAKGIDDHDAHRQEGESGEDRDGRAH